MILWYNVGVYSGSVYSDESLMVALPGEQVCNNSVSVIKVHPHTHSFHELNSGSFHSDNQKCEHSGVRKFNRAVLLIRNPYDSIWSEYQRLLSGSHVKGIKAQSFDWNRWHANVADLSHAYHNMLSKDYAGKSQYSLDLKTNVSLITSLFLYCYIYFYRRCRESIRTQKCNLHSIWEFEG